MAIHPQKQQDADDTLRIKKIFDETGWVLADGAIGTNLFRAGLETGYPPELWDVERPEDIAALHNIFIDAGAQLILTNSFGGVQPTVWACTGPRHA